MTTTGNNWELLWRIESYMYWQQFRTNENHSESLRLVLNCFQLLWRVRLSLPLVVNGYHAVVLNSSQWFAMVCNGFQWFSVVLNGFQWFSMVLIGYQLFSLVSIVQWFEWFSMFLYGSQWFWMVLNVFQWSSINGSSCQWFRVQSVGSIPFYYMLLSWYIWR